MRLYKCTYTYLYVHTHTHMHLYSCKCCKSYIQMILTDLHMHANVLTDGSRHACTCPPFQRTVSAYSSSRRRCRSARHRPWAMDCCSILLKPGKLPPSHSPFVYCIRVRECPRVSNLCDVNSQHNRVVCPTFNVIFTCKGTRYLAGNRLRSMFADMRRFVALRAEYVPICLSHIRDSQSPRYAPAICPICDVLPL